MQKIHNLLADTNLIFSEAEETNLVIPPVKKREWNLIL